LRGVFLLEIAGHLAISMSMVRPRVSASYEKLHVHSRTEAAMKLAGREYNPLKTFGFQALGVISARQGSLLIKPLRHRINI
jgi:hypothetical protein